MAGDGRTGAGSVLWPETHAGAAVRVGLHTHERVGNHARWADVRAPGVSLRADVLELGDGHDLLFGEPGEPQRRMAERSLGTGGSSGRAPYRQPVERGEQHEQPGGVQPALRRDDELLRGQAAAHQTRESERERPYRA